MFAIIGAIVCIYLTRRIYEYNRLTSGWLFLTVGFTASLVRRILTFFASPLGIPQDVLRVLQGVLSAALFVCFAWGLWSMARRFESFEIIEKQVGGKVTDFVNAYERRHRRKKKMSSIGPEP